MEACKHTKVKKFNDLKNKLIVTAFIIVCAILSVAQIAAYFMVSKAISNVFTLKPKYILTYEYYEVDQNGVETKLQREDELSIYPETVIELGADSNYTLVDARYERMDYQIGDEPVKREAGYEYTMPSSNVTIKQYYYLLPVTGNVIIHHWEDGTGVNNIPAVEVADDEEFESNIDDTFEITSLISSSNKITIAGVEQDIQRDYLNSNIYTYATASSSSQDVTISNNGTATGSFTAEDIVITYWYTAEKYNITGEVVGGNGQISNITETVMKYDSSTKDITFTPDVGYRVEKIMVYSGDEISEYTQDPTTENIGTEITDFDEELDIDTGKLVATMDIFTNVTEDKHVVVTFEERPYVAQIIAVPSDTTNLTSSAFAGEAILNHKYYTLQDALNDAYLANQTSNAQSKLVEILIIDNIRNESVNIISSNDGQPGSDESNVSIDLNGFTVNSNKTLRPTIDVNDKSTLIVKDSSILETGKLISKKGIGIFVEEDAELTLGVDTEPVSLYAPRVEGNTYGVYKEQVPTGETDPITGQPITTEGTFNFYDGRVVGNIAINGTVNDQPVLKSTYVEDNQITGKKEAYLTQVENVEARIGKKTYTQVENAINEANTIYGLNGEPVEVDLVSDAVVESTMTIPSGRNITFDLNGKTVSTQASASIFTNNGNLTVIDSNDNNYDYILTKTSTDDFVLDENNVLTATGSGNSTISGYIPVDLTAVSSAQNVTITVNAEQTTDGGDYIYGFAKIKEDRVSGTASGENGRFMYLTSNQSAADYSTIVKGGKKYYLHLGFTKTYGTGTLKINSVTINGQEVKIGTVKGSLTKTTGTVITNNAGATLTVNSGKIYTPTSPNTGAIVNDGTLVVNGGILDSGNGYAITNNNTFTMNNGVLMGVYSLVNNGTATMNDGASLKTLYNANVSGATITYNNGLVLKNIYNVRQNVETASIIVNNGDIAEIVNYYITGAKIDIYGTNCPNYTYVNNYGNNSEVNIIGGKFYTVNNYSNGIVNISGGTIEYNGDGNRGAPISVGDNASILNITGGTIIDKATWGNNGVINVSNTNYPGSVNISGNVTITSSYRHLIYNYEGLVNIQGGTFIQNGTQNYIIYNSTNNSTTNIGIKNDNNNTTVSQTSPTLRSKGYCVNGNMGNINFYDGELIASQESQVIIGAIHEIEEYNSLGEKLQLTLSTTNNAETYGDFNNYARITLAPISGGVARILKNSIAPADIALLSNDQYTTVTDGGNEYYVFYQLENAIAVCNSNAGNTQTTIELINNISEMHTITIAQGQNIILDLNGNTINAYNNATLFVNNGTISITNTQSTGEIKLRDKFLTNSSTGNVTLNVNVSTTREAITMITNEGDLTIEGGTITGKYVTVINNTNQLTINNGTINANNSGSNGSTIIYNNGSARCVVNNGTLNADSGYAINNAGTSTVKITGGTFISSGYTINNTSTSKYVENVSEPALYVTGITIQDNRYGYGIYDNSSNESDIWIIKDTNSTLIINKSICIEKANLKMEEVTSNSRIYAKGPVTTITNSNLSDEIHFQGSNTTDTITGGTTGSIGKEGTGTLLISGVTVNGGVGNSSTGDVTIKNSTVTRSWPCTISNESSGSITIIDKQGPGEPNKRTEITNTYSNNAIQNNSTGTITIGEKDGVVDSVYPKIESSGSYGVYNGSNGIFNFYDGSIKGSTNSSYKAIYGIASDVEDGYEVVVSENDTVNHTETCILGKLVMAKILKSSIQSANLSGLTYEDTDPDYYEFYSISDAVTACTDGTQTSILIVRDATLVTTETIGANKNIILDLNGYKLSMSKENNFVNNGTTQIIDSSANTTGSIFVGKQNAITNAGTLTISNIKTDVNCTGSTIDSSYVINNTGTATLAGNTVTMNSSANISVIKNSGTLTVTGGTYSRTNAGNFIYNHSSGDATINGSTLTYLDLYNTGAATLEAIDLTFYYGNLINDSTVVSNAGSKPAFKVKGGTYGLNGYRIAGGNVTNNTGEMVLENSTNTLNLNASYGNSFNDLIVNGGKVVINSGTYNMDVVVNAGTLDINGGSLQGVESNDRIYQYSFVTSSGSTTNINSGTVAYGNITNASGATMNIYGGTIEDGQINNNGIMNIGNNANAIDTSSPTISCDFNASYSVTDTGILNFYDGTITYLKTPVIGTIDAIPTNSQIIYERSGNNHIYYLSTTDIVATIGEGGNLQQFTTLEDAINACQANTHTKINMQKSISIAKGQELEIDSTQDIVLNLNGKTIFANCEDVLFTNEGTFEIADTTGGSITTHGAGLVENSGDVKVSGGTLTLDVNTVSRTFINNTGTGTVEITGGNLTTTAYYKYQVASIQAHVINSTSTGNISVTGGTLNGIGHVEAYSADTPGYAIKVNNTDANIKPTITFGGNAVITNQAAGYGIVLENAIFNMTGGENNSNRGDTAAIALTNTVATITGGTVLGNTNVNATSTVTVSGNNTQLGSFTNYGTVTVNGGTLTGQFENRKNATFNGGKISTTDRYSLYIYTGSQTINIGNDFIIENKANRTDAYGIYMSVGATCNISEGVTITSDYGTGIYLTVGTLTLGVKARPVNTATPAITGAVNGVYHSSGTFNFYDGIITGTSSGAIGGSAPNDLPDNYTVQTANNGTVAWLENSALASDVAMVNNVRYKSLQSAINATSSGVITIVGNITLESPVLVQSGKNIVIDLCSYKIEYDGAEATIENNGTLAIVDSNEDGTDPTEFAIIKNSTGPAIENNGTLTIGSDADSTIYSNSPRIIGATYAVVNVSGATFNFYDGVLKGATAAVSGTITNTSSITGYTLTDGTETISGTTYYTKYYN